MDSSSSPRRIPISLKYSQVTQSPLSSSEECQHRRECVDYSRRISKEIAASGKAHRQIRVYADGVFDMFHSGHARMLMQAKNCFANVYLIAAVHSDEVIHNKKGLTVNTHKERIEAVRHCRYVDEVYTNAPWIIHSDFLEEQKIDFVCHDDLPYPTDGIDMYQEVKDRGQFVATQRTEGISSTDLMTRIIKNYDQYVERVVSKGIFIDDLIMMNTKERKRIQLYDIFTELRARSHEFVNGFVGLFGRDGILQQYFSDIKERMVRAISQSADM